jgi:hypothetical protein
MSLMHLFEPPQVPPPSRARRVTLVDVETSEEALQRQRRAALEKARAAIAQQGRKPRTRKTPEQIKAERRARYAAQRAAGIPPVKKQSTYAALSDAEKERRRKRQRDRYHANREKERARAVARFQALPPEERSRRMALAAAWKAANRDRVNARTRQLRAERSAARIKTEDLT